jgi:hypothetical protein
MYPIPTENLPIEFETLADMVNKPLTQEDLMIVSEQSYRRGYMQGFAYCLYYMEQMGDDPKLLKKLDSFLNNELLNWRKKLAKEKRVSMPPMFGPDRR